MSQFYSELLTWTAFGLIGGAALLGSAPGGPLSGESGETIARATSDPLPEPIDIRELDMAAADTAELSPVTPLITEAELQAVEFTATGAPVFAMPTGAAGAEPGNSGLVTGESVNIRSGPGTSFAVVARAVRDDRLQVTGQRDGSWIEIVLPFGTDDPAWIHGSYFSAPEPPA
ncbi:SH3 domain-containing protein [Oceanibium sediminis]|uniref:SH3 domain-containing protein n=1 Tax=Oceanibium sediminis TaxID=2026339 RepID=UPI000DD3DFE9|nr:SH3 domain-containing protein [Oceanibium sediminis]